MPVRGYQGGDAEGGEVMGDKTGINWTDATWNPVVGCTIVSDGCSYCYAMPQAARLEAMGVEKYAGLTRRTADGRPVWSGAVRLAEEALDQPLRWQRPRKIFVNSMSDLFHDGLADEQIDQVFAVMALARRHTFQVLTKRSERMRCYLSDPERVWKIFQAVRKHIDNEFMENSRLAEDELPWPWPLPNVWVGVTVENQQAAELRVPDLLKTPAAVRWVSAEPLVGALNLRKWLGPQNEGQWLNVVECGHSANRYGINWIVVGGESGREARAMHPEWARQIQQQCAASGVPFWFKQWGEYGNPGPATMLNVHEKGLVLCADGSRWIGGTASAPRGSVAVRRLGAKAAGRLLDGVEYSQWPEVR